MTTGHRGKIYKDSDGQWRWTHWASSDRVATSGEGLTKKSHAIEQFETLFPGVPYEVEGEGE